MPRKFLTPPTLPEDTQCRGLVIPASKEWLGIFSDALLATTYAYNYEQVNSTDLTPDAVAQSCYQIYLAWLDSTCGGGGCTLPDLDSPIYRRNPTTGRWEYLNNGVWQEPTGDNAIPDPAPREEPTEAEKQCGAASNAAHVLRELYSSILSSYDEFVAPAVNQANIAFDVAVIVGSQFGPVSASFLALSDFAWTVFTQALTEITNDDWSDEFEQLLVCILQEASSVDEDGAVTFNFFEVNSNLVGFILPVVDEFVRVRWQVWYLLQMIGEQGLNVAGGTTAVEGDCITCDTWCYHATPADLGVTVVRGYMTSAGFIRTDSSEAYGTLVVDTTNCVITRVGVVLRGNGATSGYAFVSASPSDGPLAQVWTVGYTGFPIGRTSDDNAAWKSNSDSTTLEFYGSSFNASWVEIVDCYVFGTGINPFAVGSNC